jgi:polyvinyl alcohol dehydrogenase (cytochrome)
VWNTPTVDLKRGVLYFGTGNNYSKPATNASDSIVAVDMKTGRIRWIHQVLEKDIWNVSCVLPGDHNSFLCEPDAPDADFASSPALVELKNGKQIILAGNKAGTVFALDPDADGKLLWERSISKGGPSGGILWGSAVDGDRIYAASAYPDPKNPEASGGLTALDLGSGGVVWKVYAPPCGERKPCKPTQSAAVTAIRGVVFSATMDGQLRAYSASDGRVIWEYKAVQDYRTVNGVKANGGSMSNGGPTIVNGMLFTNSGYSHHGGIIPGNVLLAFGVE